MGTRPEALQSFIRTARIAYAECVFDPEGRRSADQIFGAIETECGQVGSHPVKLPVCSHLRDVKPPDTTLPAVRDLMDAFFVLEPDLSWHRRPTYDAATASENFCDGHANCMILGPDGFEARLDVMVGASLLAPHVRYPDHTHSPEETYLVVTEGEFRQGAGDWFSPGIGGSFYNVPMIKHTMRSGATPLLAFWALWLT